MMTNVTNSPGLHSPDLHPVRPCVYLDQWVWIRLARAANGEPREASDLRVLAAVRDAAADGVAFPLSTTHHIETSKITSPRQRRTLPGPWRPSPTAAPSEHAMSCCATRCCTPCT